MTLLQTDLIELVIENIRLGIPKDNKLNRYLEIIKTLFFSNLNQKQNIHSFLP